MKKTMCFLLFLLTIGLSLKAYFYIGYFGNYKMHQDIYQVKDIHDSIISVSSLTVHALQPCVKVTFGKDKWKNEDGELWCIETNFDLPSINPTSGEIRFQDLMFEIGLSKTFL